MPGLASYRLPPLKDCSILCLVPSATRISHAAVGVALADVPSFAAMQPAAVPHGVAPPALPAVNVAPVMPPGALTAPAALTVSGLEVPIYKLSPPTAHLLVKV